MHEIWHVIWELMLILGSVLIFRSVWLFLDINFGNRALGVLLLLGFVLVIPALYFLNSHLEDYYKKKTR
ncbi:MAG TPA: hypothetical protein VI612_01905 [Candidatus Nanoarchaeia archaeon]|nr:hypothetical protein [Candidatus Nanoarchaeia archaeon]